MSHGVLFRTGAEKQIRIGFLEEDLLEAVIGLPWNLFYCTGIPGSILVFNRNKPKERLGKVLFISAEKGYLEGRAQNFLRNEDIDMIVSVFQDYSEIERYSRVVDMSEIRDNDFNLSISRYVDISDSEPEIDIKETWSEIRNLEQEKTESMSKLGMFLKDLGLNENDSE